MSIIYFILKFFFLMFLASHLEFILIIATIQFLLLQNIVRALMILLFRSAIVQFFECFKISILCSRIFALLKEFRFWSWLEFFCLLWEILNSTRLSIRTELLISNERCPGFIALASWIFNSIEIVYSKSWRRRIVILFIIW